MARSHPALSGVLLPAAVIASAVFCSGVQALPLSGHIPYAAEMRSAPLGRVSNTEPMSLAIGLPLRNTAGLQALLNGLYDSHSPLYGHFLTPEEFTAEFGPSEGDYEQVIRFATTHGLTVTGTHPNRLFLDVAGSASAVENAFSVQLLEFRSPEGRVFHAPDAEPVIPDELAGRITNIVGLDNAEEYHSYARPLNGGSPRQIGTGPGNGLSPSDIKAAYNLASAPVNGAGQTLAVFELSGYHASDITGYESHFGLPAAPLQNVLVDGYSGAAGSGADEVTLDIELQIALAPGASKVMVYEGPNTSSGLIDTYNRIATDNLAKEVSTSWGVAESGTTASAMNSENTIFTQMAAQGQSIFAASGDSGAYDNGKTLSVDDPASQPDVTGVGGTRLSVSAGEVYSSESTWNTNNSISGGAGGGGISSFWAIPGYQQGLISAASKGSTTMRNVPDVALDADPNTGYSIYYNGGWVIYGGTSCAAPLWSAFAALVNQQRLSAGSGLIGFANPSLYSVGTGAHYTADFHDIANGTTNLYYPAVTGLDDATGWGSFNGANLLADLAPTGPPTTVPAAPTGVTASAGNGQVKLKWNAASTATSYNIYRSTSTGAETVYKTGITTTSYTDTGLTNGTTYYYEVSAVNSIGESSLSAQVSAKPVAVSQLLGNAGFEKGSSSPSPWVVTAGVIANSSAEPPHSGAWDAWLDGYGSAHTDTLYQAATIPSTITSAKLTFWLHIDTAETTTTIAYDTLKVQVRNSSGTVLATLATYSNLNHASGYSQKSFDLTAYKGQSIQVYLVGIEDSSLQTSFVVDDFALTVQ